MALSLFLFFSFPSLVSFHSRVGDDEDIGLFPGLATTRPGRYQRLVLFIKVLSLLCPNLTVASLQKRSRKGGHKRRMLQEEANERPTGRASYSLLPFPWQLLLLVWAALHPLGAADKQEEVCQERGPVVLRLTTGRNLGSALASISGQDNAKITFFFTAIENQIFTG